MYQPIFPHQKSIKDIFKCYKLLLITIENTQALLSSATLSLKPSCLSHHSRNSCRQLPMSSIRGTNFSWVYSLSRSCWLPIWSSIMQVKLILVFWYWLLTLAGKPLIWKRGNIWLHGGRVLLERAHEKLRCLWVSADQFERKICVVGWLDSHPTLY